MSKLISTVKCKRCSKTIEVPPLPIIFNETPQEKATRLGALEMKHLISHLVKEHPEVRDHMLAWGASFSEFYWLAAFDLSKCEMLRNQYDTQRILLLYLAQQQMQTGISSSEELIQAIKFYEETERVKELEAAGYTITRGFMQEKSPVLI